MKYLSCLLVGLFCLCGFALQAQEPGYVHLNERDGLPSQTVFGMVEDHLGYIYFGTANGLVKYNGFSFDVIENKLGKSVVASNLAIDTKGNIWFSNFNFELFVYSEKKGIQKIDVVNETCFNSKGQFVLINGLIYTIYQNTLVEINPQTKKVKKTLLDAGYMLSIAKDGMNNIYVSNEINLTKIERLNDGKLNITSFQNDPLLNNSCQLVFDKKNQFAFYSKFSPKTENQSLEKLRNTQICVSNYTNGYGYASANLLWVATGNGLFLFNGDGSPKYYNELLLKGYDVSYVIQDTRRNIWISTLNSGVFRLNTSSILNYSFYDKNNKVNGVYSINNIDNDLYVGMQNGEVKIINNKKIETWNSGLNRSIYSVHNIANNQFILNYSLINKGESKGRILDAFGAVKSIVKSGNELIVGNNTGVYRTETNKNYIFKKENIIFCKEGNCKSLNIEPRGNILAGRTNRLFKDSKNRVWISNGQGIYFLKNDTLTQLILPKISQDTPLDFAESNTGEIYLLFLNRGIWIWNGSAFDSLVIDNNKWISAIPKRIVLNQNILWIATTKGLVKHNLNNNSTYYIRKNNGLLSDDIQDMVFVESTLWVSTIAGISKVNASFVPGNNNIPLLYLKKIVVNDKPLNFKSTEQIVLEHNQNNISFYFDGLEYKSFQLLSFKYRLLGQSNTWLSANGKDGQVTFLGLPYGDYTLEIKAINDAGLASKLIVVPFKIKQLFWQSWWFWGALIFILFGSFFLYVRNRNIEKQRQLKLESNLRESQLSSLKAQMNPHFMFNALNSIQDFILLNDKRNANVFLGKFADLMRMVLDMSNNTYIAISKEIRLLTLYLELEALRFEDSFEYTIDIDKDLEVDDWQLPSMIVQPFIENAVKHGLLHKRTERVLKVEFKNVINGFLEVIITDNGVGRQESERMNQMRKKQHTSFATGATYQRLKLLNAGQSNVVAILYDDLKDAQGHALGTRVQLTIKVNYV